MLSNIIPLDAKGRVDRESLAHTEEIVIKSATIGTALPTSHYYKRLKSFNQKLTLII